MISSSQGLCLYTNRRMHTRTQTLDRSATVTGASDLS
jgi:hypothetical protein